MNFRRSAATGAADGLLARSALAAGGETLNLVEVLSMDRVSSGTIATSASKIACVLPACAGVDLGKKRPDRRPGFVSKPVLVSPLRADS
jgi:hypothetical protein